MKREKANKKKTAVKPSSKKTNTKTKRATVKKPSLKQSKKSSMTKPLSVEKTKRNKDSFIIEIKL